VRRAPRAGDSPSAVPHWGMDRPAQFRRQGVAHLIVARPAREWPPRSISRTRGREAPGAARARNSSEARERRRIRIATRRSSSPGTRYDRRHGARRALMGKHEMDRLRARSARVPYARACGRAAVLPPKRTARRTGHAYLDDYAFCWPPLPGAAGRFRRRGPRRCRRDRRGVMADSRTRPRAAFLHKRTATRSDPSSQAGPRQRHAVGNDIAALALGRSRSSPADALRAPPNADHALLPQVARQPDGILEPCWRSSRKLLSNAHRARDRDSGDLAPWREVFHGVPNGTLACYPGGLPRPAPALAKPA